MNVLVLLLVSFLSLADCQLIPSCTFLKTCLSGVTSLATFQTLMPLDADLDDATLCKKASELRYCSWGDEPCENGASYLLDIYLAFRIGNILCLEYGSGYYIYDIAGDICTKPTLPFRGHLITGFRFCILKFKRLQQKGVTTALELSRAVKPCFEERARFLCGNPLATFYEHLFDNSDADIQLAILRFSHIKTDSQFLAGDKNSCTAKPFTISVNKRKPCDFAPDSAGQFIYRDNKLAEIYK